MARSVRMATWSWPTVFFEAVAVGGEKYVPRTEAALLASGLFFFFRHSSFSSLHLKVGVSVRISSLPLLEWLHQLFVGRMSLDL